MSYETIELTQLTGNLTGYYILSGIGSLIVSIGCILIVYKLYNWVTKSLDASLKVTNAKTFYITNVYALKTGMIKKIADEKEVSMIFEPETIETRTLDDAYDEMVEDVQNDIKK